MDVYDPQRKRKRRVRERHEARRLRRSHLVVSPDRSEGDKENTRRSFKLPGNLPGLRNIELPIQFDGQILRNMRHTLYDALQDAWWHIRRNPKIARGFVFGLAMIGVLYILSYLLTGRIMPNVSTIGIGVGGMSQQEAENAIRAAWLEYRDIDLIIRGEVVTKAAPRELGITLDVLATAKAAKDVGLNALPFGAEVTPIVSIDYLTAQNYLLNVADTVNTRPMNAGYEWDRDTLVGIRGTSGYMLDVSLTLEHFDRDANVIVDRGELELLIINIPPDNENPEPFLEKAHSLFEQPLELRGFDPYTNQHYTWPIDRDTFASWLSAGGSTLTLREESFLPYVDALNSTLNPDDTQRRFISKEESSNMMREAIANNETVINLRVRYSPTEYVVVGGDTTFRIARKTGIPFYLIDEANPNVNLDRIFVGDTLMIPSRDVTMPNAPLPDKRIVVDLVTQYLVAYENGQPIFEWPISSGVLDAPTSPGIYQILNHSPLATGSSATLCNEAGLQCGVWEMNWFMGIYRVSPQIVNGFHGDVLLPNGNFLGDGLIGQTTTFGCVMSSDDQAKLLYDWAGVGTVVEILSPDFLPMSDLGQLTLQRTRGA